MRPGALEQAAVGLHLDIGAAEFAVVPALDLAAELGRHGHLAVADAEHRHAGIEDQLAARAASPLRAPIPGRRRGSPPSASSRGRRLRPSGTARSRNRRPPRARGGRSVGSPGCRNRRSESCHAPRPRRAPARGAFCAAVMDSRYATRARAPATPPGAWMGGIGQRVCMSKRHHVIPERVGAGIEPEHIRQHSGLDAATSPGMTSMDAYRLLSTDTKNPSVPVRRGVISQPSGDCSAALARRRRPCPRARRRSASGGTTANSGWRATKARTCSPFSCASTEQVM